MSFDWLAYLNLAQELAGQATSRSNQEAKLRSAISRAYYSAFCKARNHLRDKEGHSIPSRMNPHEYVRDQFVKSADKARKGVGVNLNRLRIDRNKADYDDTVAGLSATTKKSLRRAKQIISVLWEFLW